MPITDGALVAPIRCLVGCVESVVKEKAGALGISSLATRRRLISSHVASRGRLFDIGVAVLFALCRVISSHVASHGMLLGILDTVRDSLIAAFLHAVYPFHVAVLSALR